MLMGACVKIDLSCEDGCDVRETGNWGARHRSRSEYVRPEPPRYRAWYRRVQGRLSLENVRIIRGEKAKKRR